MEQNKRRQVAKISVFITSIFVIFLSITYAFINMTLTGTKRQVITAGSLEIELEEENAITLSNAMPMYDEVGMIQDSFDFQIKNVGTHDTAYSLKLIDITDSSKEKLDTNIVRYGLTKNGENTIAFLSDLKSGQLDAGVISGGQINQYNLRLWIDSKVTDNNKIERKTLSYRIDLEYGIDVSFGSLIKEREIVEEYWGGGTWEITTSNADYYQYSNQITNIVLENQINVPTTVAEDKQWDMSAAGNSSVMAYLEEDSTSDSENVSYRLHIQGQGGVIANPNSAALFYGFPNLASISGFQYLDISNAKFIYELDSGNSAFSIFGNCPKLNLDLSDLDASNVTNMSFMFQGYNGEGLTIGNWNTSNVTTMSYMFSFYSGDQPLDLSSLDTSKVTNMDSIFSSYSSSQVLDLSSLDTSKVTDMSDMFSSYSSDQPLDLSSFDTSNVTDMSWMFNFYEGGALTIGNWNTPNLTDMSYTFENYSGGLLTIGDWNIPNVTDMSHMFSNYSGGLLTIGNWNTSSVIDMSYMFDNYKGPNLVIGNWDTSSIVTMESMFFDYHADHLDMSSFEFPTSANLKYLFTNRNGNTHQYTLTVKDEKTKAFLVDLRSNLTYWPTIEVAS